MRDDFPNSVKDALCKRVGSLCSNPDCRRPTSGPQSDPAKVINVGAAAHITAASQGGPRYDASISPEERSSIENGVWLCQTCAKLVDNDPVRYDTDLLRNWKRSAEQHALESLEAHFNPEFQSSRSFVLSKINVAGSSRQLIIDLNTGNYIVFNPTDGRVVEYYKNTSTILNISHLPLWY